MAAAATGSPPLEGIVARPGRRRIAIVLWLAFGANAAAVVWLWLHGGGVSGVHGTGDLLTSLGRVTGLVGTYLALVQLLLLARLPWLERVAGFDHLTVWHRRNDSQMSRLNRGEVALGDCHAGVRSVLRRCEELRKATGGYFDAGAAGAVWVGRGLAPAGALDPAGFVKGWAAEGASRILERAGAGNYSVNAGGDIRLRGGPRPGESWRIGVQHPRERDRVAAVLVADDLAIATSGAYERGDHVVDPHTGRAPEDVLSVTVVGPDLALADAYATAAFAMGAAGPEWTATAAGLWWDDDPERRHRPPDAGVPRRAGVLMGRRTARRTRGALACMASAVAATLSGCGQDRANRVISGPSTVPAPAASTGTAATPGTKTVNGALVSTRYGDVQVAVTFTKGKVSDVEPVVLPTDRPRSAEITQQAEPALRQESLQSQTGNINILSGATYTSEAWAQSLGAALAAR